MPLEASLDPCWCGLRSPHSSSSELSPQSSTLLQTWSVRRHTRSFRQRNGLVGGQGSFAGGKKTQTANGEVLQWNYKYINKSIKSFMKRQRNVPSREIEKQRSIKYASSASKEILVSDNLNPPHMSASSSELSPQSSLPSHTHVWSLHKVLLQMNSSARQKKAAAIEERNETFSAANTPTVKTVHSKENRSRKRPITGF